MFFDNPARTFVDAGDMYSEYVTFDAVTNNPRVYLLEDHTLVGLSRKLSMLLGRGSLPPLWAFGYQQSRWSYRSTEEALEVIDRMDAAGVPCDAIYFDIDYMDGYRVFTHDARAFKDLAPCLNTLRSRGVRSLCIVDPGVKIDNQYEVFKRLMSDGRVLCEADGSSHVVKVWPGRSVLPDFFDPATRDLWAELQKEWLDSFPFAGIWNDMNEPANWLGGSPRSAEAHTAAGKLGDSFNLYGCKMAEASAEGWRRAFPGQRSIIISRSGYPGLQNHAVCWHGDNSSWWEHLRLALNMAVQFSLAGLYFTGADVPGFNASPPDYLAVRFFQLGAFLPFFRGHCSYLGKCREPYAFREPERTYIKEAILLRYSLLREWYGAFERAAREGVTPLLPVLDAGNRLVRDQLLLFDKILVAPVVERDQTQRLVYLPEGTWFPWEQPGSGVAGGGYFTCVVDGYRLPLFVRAGSIVVRNTPRLRAEETISLEERYDIYPDANGSAEGYWYGDDGISIEPKDAVRLRLRYDPTTKAIQKEAWRVD